MKEQNLVFQTVSREIACNVYEERPQGTDGGIYYPDHIKF